MVVRKFVQEASKLAQASNDGTYPVVIITEGTGSTGVYSSELLEKSVHVFEGVGSYMNHPIDPSKPHLRPAQDITGRIRNVRVGEDAGKVALIGDYTPDEWHAAWVKEYHDMVGLSIFCGASGDEMDDGRINVAEFDSEDPYRSVDIVIAAGRGGRFKRAEESLRAIESSLGHPVRKPAVEASAEEKEGEHMDEKDIKAIAAALAAAVTESLKPVIDFVNESAAATAAETQTEATAEALENARAEGVKAATESLTAIDAAELPTKIAEGLRAKVLEGKDVTESIAEAKAVLEAAHEDEGGKPGVRVIENAGGGSNTPHDWSL